ncbi:uncharacterized protein LOC117787336 [Drosophila innubila]|uniref:uncharacterized protein LOC117787336 n=1 Tax=Drosophila innubila TaxID=198719 RepID=UPI00148C9E7D|nr:uncharacterized protein LOC117787336 [Drosophila innubila]XP_034481726.1 uncharacterized protein LOC117787336 [Drosophila innubila]
MWLIYNFFKCLALLQLLAQSQGGIVQEAKRHIRAEFNDALGHRSYHGSHWHNGQRVHRLYMPHSHQRWSGRRKAINHPHPFSRWSQWTSCDEDCIRRRERYCRAKRKCGHTKHMEQRKCLHCNPSVKWHEPRQEHHFQGNLRHSNPNTPSIIINAAAAASSGSPFQPHRSHSYSHSDIDSVEVVHRKPPHVYPIEEAEEDDDSHYDGDQGDFFVLKRNRKRDRQQLRPNPRQHPRQRNRKKSKPKHRPHYIDDDFEDYLEKRSLTSQQRSLGGAESDAGLEGDVFQYEDFDFEPDNAYGESDEYSEYRNISLLSPTKERNTPDGLLPRHRRIYSKWSRWTRCSPKCTTRRYKKCRVSEQCGREVLREIAYCYTEGSFCQQWLQTQVQKAPVYETRPGPGSSSGHGGALRRMHTEPGAGTLSKNDVNVIMSGKGYRGPEYSPLKLHCGIARNGQRSVYNMLKIIGGKSAKKGEWPWQVAILNRYKEAFCGGTLIAPLWVLTAAHCVRKVLYVRFGEHNLEYEDGTEVQLRVRTSFKHPKFDKKTVDSDVALLRLPKPVNSTSWIGYSCLPRPYQPLPRNVVCTVIGWGKRRNRDAMGTSILQQADLPIIPMDNCRSVYHDYTITKNMFCAGHQRGRIDTCAGDSGGPLLCRDTTKANHPWTIFGITSFGDGCAKRNKFGIYAKVPNYVDWVWSVINCDGNCKFH